MNAHLPVHAIPGPMKKHHVLENPVYCVHCRRMLGTTGDAIERARLQRRHECAQGLLDKQPATPPPYN
jgi:hypothetical protein